MDTKFSSAIHILILISAADTPMSSEQIASSVGTNASYIRKLTTRLSKAGIIEGRRGITGFALKKKPADITLLDIYKAVMEVSNIHFFDIHQNPNDRCIVGQSIKPVLSGMFKEIENQIAIKLEAMTLDKCMRIMRHTIKDRRKIGENK